MVMMELRRIVELVMMELGGGMGGALEAEATTELAEKKVEWTVEATKAAAAQEIAGAVAATAAM